VLGAGLAVALLTVLVFGVAGAAHAHPLGNFSVNRFAAVEVGLERVALRYVVDMAEVPTFQEMTTIDADGDETATPAELNVYAHDLGVRLRHGLHLEIDGRPARLDPAGATASLRSGQAGLDVLRVEIRYVAPLAREDASIRFADSNYSDRIGWREIVAYGVGGQGIAGSSVPSASASDELRAYPEDLLSSPLRLTGASIEADPGAPAFVGGKETSPDGTVSSLGRIGESLSALLGRNASPLLIATALSLALGAGALHALGPGHGKTIMAAYLVGAEGRVRHALSVGVAVSLMHTASVVALGLATLWASSLFPPESVLPWLSLVSGVVVLALGAWLLAQRLRARRSSNEATHHHSHGHEEHSHHGLEGGHSHPHTHHHRRPEGSLMSWKGLGAIAVSGGLLPSPTALVVLLGAVAVHRVALGVAMVGAFSVGLAAALTGVGILVLKARDAAARRFGRGMGTALGIASATAILVLGTVLTSKAVISLWGSG
jgi:ABC-type nickel/cobalt efflux system permease component RcnA